MQRKLNYEEREIKGSVLLNDGTRHQKVPLTQRSIENYNNCWKLHRKYMKDLVPVRIDEDITRMSAGLLYRSHLVATDNRGLTSKQGQSFYAQ